MTVVRYEPWALVSRLQKDIDRLFGAPSTTAADSGAWLPPVDIHEEANQFALGKRQRGPKQTGTANFGRRVRHGGNCCG